jgi:hypothetical protein
LHVLTDAYILSFAATANPSSNPGVPFAALSDSKADVIANHGPLLCAAVRERIELLSTADLNREKQGQAVDLVKANLVDPVRLFIKNELHSLEKIETGRLRLISSVSFIDEIIDKILFSEQDKTEIANWWQIPSKPGIGFTDGYLKLLDDYVIPEIKKRKGKNPKKSLSGSDASGWDWCYQLWMYWAEYKRRTIQAGADTGKKELLRKLFYNRIVCIAHSVFVSSGGRMFAQLIGGIMLSGVPITSSANSFARCLSATMIGADWVMAAGDDAVETTVDEAVAKYLELGVRIKYYHEIGEDESYEFCSHLYTRAGAYLVSWEKCLCNLLNSPFDVELLVQFTLELRHSPELQRCRSLILGSGWIPKTESFNGQQEENQIRGQEEG